MLTLVDRLLVTAGDRRDVVDPYQRLLGAELVREDRVAHLCAQRSVLRVGRGEVEVLEPDGLGPLAHWMGRSGGGLFAVGFATNEPGRVADQLRARGRAAVEEGDRLFLAADTLGIPGLQAVVGPEEEREPAGVLRSFYEVTSLVEDAGAMAGRLAEVFALEPRHFVPIESAQYGYAGVLTLFAPDALDRVEFVTPFDFSRTMGRYYRRRGPRLYMAYAEADDTAVLRERLLEQAPRDWTGPRDATMPDNLYLHPKALGGVMLGVSRTSYAWTWSGRPERVGPASS